MAIPIFAHALYILVLPLGIRMATPQKENKQAWRPLEGQRQNKAPPPGPSDLTPISSKQMQPFCLFD